MVLMRRMACQATKVIDRQINWKRDTLMQGREPRNLARSAGPPGHQRATAAAGAARSGRAQ